MGFAKMEGGGKVKVYMVQSKKWWIIRFVSERGMIMLEKSKSWRDCNAQMYTTKTLQQYHQLVPVTKLSKSS